MPLYEYECDACGKRFERIQKYSDPLADVCPHCGKSPVRKLLSSPAIQFKGSGFYITDYAKSKDSTSTKGSKESSKDSSKESTKETKDTSSTSSSTDSSTKTTKTE